MNGRLVQRSDLTAPQRAQMLALMQAHFEGVTGEQFARDLGEKNWVILLEDGAGRLRGFSTLLFCPTVFCGERIHVVHSGDTIVDFEAWGSSALARTWLGAIDRLRRETDATPLYWLLLTSGFRTYRFLPVFLREFFPRYDASTPSSTQMLLDALARERFGRNYDPARGIVRFDSPQVLRGRLREIPAGRRRDAHVEFFARRNTGFVCGDELVCLADLSPANLTAAGRRMLRAAERSFEHAEVAAA